MDALQKVFEYQGAQVSTVMGYDHPWFVAADVCKILEIANTTDAVNRLDDDERTLVYIEGASNGLPVNVINEPGLYSLVLASRKPEAKAFKRWITHEVLPSIRQNGSYSVKPLSPTEALLQAVQILDQQAKQIARLEEKVTVTNHRIDTLDAVNIIGAPQQRLNAMVRKYAHANGLTFSKAWNDFAQDYNTAFHTNIKLLRDNYATKYNLRKFTIPQYLANTGHLEDGLRVADKMLNLH